MEKNEWKRLIDTIQGMENNADNTLDDMESRSEAYGFVQGAKDGYQVAQTFARNITDPVPDAVEGFHRVLAILKDSDVTFNDIWHIGRAHAFTNVIVLLQEMKDAEMAEGGPA